MNAKYKELWLKALRSEEYKQGTGALCKVLDKDGKLLIAQEVDIEGGTKHYCCLGVLHDIINKDTNNFRAIQGGWLKDEVYIKSELDWAEQTRLSNLNDKELYTFEQIAEIVEKEL